jgi:hypothetical protein
MKSVFACVALTVSLVAFEASLSPAVAQGWRSASRAPVGLAPDPATTPEAVVQVYAARAVSWRGFVGVHSWIAVKPERASDFTVYEVMGWRLRRTGTSVVRSAREPDGRWFGNEPELLADVRGAEAAVAIEQIEKAVTEYPYADRYRVWPGPNSNTFTAFVLRDAPALRVDLPATAIGKDYLGPRLMAAAPSGTGLQLSVLGIVGLLAAVEEGFEINLLGLTFGVDPADLSLKAPFVGRIRTNLSIVILASLVLGAFALRRYRSNRSIVPEESGRVE